MTSITLAAPAKVNLFLKVLNKRKDSYHNILTLFERITLADEITISKIPEGIFVVSDKFITRNPMDNIVHKAARLILSDSKVKGGVKITIKKRIPIAAGMGGGSSDAASALIGMNKLFKLALSERSLLGLAGQLGADVGFFMLDTPFALGTSRGDVLYKVDFRLRPWHLIIYPGFKVPTKDMYEAFAARKREKPLDLIPRQSPGSSPEPLPLDLTKGTGDVKIRLGFRNALDFSALEEMLYNDLQDTVTAKKKVVGRIIKRLASSLGRKSIVSGSGPSVFCLYKTGREAIIARDRLLACVPAVVRKNWQIFVAGTKE